MEWLRETREEGDEAGTVSRELDAQKSLLLAAFVFPFFLNFSGCFRFASSPSVGTDCFLRWTGWDGGVDVALGSGTHVSLVGNISSEATTRNKNRWESTN
jgi:hypothetical protein